MTSRQGSRRTIDPTVEKRGRRRHISTRAAGAQSLADLLFPVLHPFEWQDVSVFFEFLVRL